MENADKSKEMLLLEIQKLEAANQELNSLLLIKSNEILNLETKLNKLEVEFNFVEELKLQERKLKKAEEIGKFGNWQLNLKDKILISSAGANKIYGIESSHNSISEIKSYALEEYREMLDKALTELITNSIQYNVQYKIKRKSDGKIIDVHSIGEYDKESNIIIGAIQDISERKRNEELILQNEEKISNLFNAMNVGVILQDPMSKILLCNPKALEYLGLTEDQLLGKTSFDPDWNVIHEDGTNFPGNTHPVAVAIEKKIPIKNVIMGVYNPSKNERIWLLVDAIPQLDINGNVKQAVVTFIDISERKKSEQSLRETNEYLENLINYANAPIIVWDTKFKITRFNHAFEELTGHLESEVLGKTLDLLFPKELAENYLKLIYKTLEGERWETVEIKILHKNNSVKTVLWNTATLFESDGITPIATIAQGQDITERKAIEDSLRLSESNLEVAQRIAKVGSWSWDMVNNKVDWSIEMFRVFDIDPETYDGKPEKLIEVLHPDDLDAFLNNMNTNMLDGSSPALEYRVIHRDGNIHNIYAEGRITFDEAGKPVYGVGTAQDITDRKKIENTLRETNEYLENLINYANAPIIVWDTQFKITRFNHAFEELTGHLESEVLDKPLDLLFPEDLADEYLKLIYKTLTGERWETVEIKILHKDNSIKTVLWNSATLFESDGFTPIATIAQGQDITKRKEAEYDIKKKNHMLLELNATKDKFFSIIAHDLKNPLSNFKQMTELLHDSYNDFEDQELLDFLDLMKKSSTNLLSLLENLLEWSRSQRGKLNFEPVEINLFLITEEVLGLLESNAKNKNIKIQSNIKKTTLVFSDLNLLNTILRNLISNAIKFTKNYGEININSTETIENVIYSVTDNGVGMSDSVLKKLFKIELTESTLGTNKEKGTGLGLILCKEFVEKQGGKIWVESKLGEGSTFYFTIPKSN